MSGQCYQCGSGFGRFKKEYGCKNCGFSFCGKCLTKKTEIPKLKNEKHSVCNKCFDILTGKAEPAKQTQYSPPEAYKKRLAALNDPSTKKSTHHGQPTAKASSKTKHRGMSKADVEIADRLSKLKAEKKPKGPLSSEEELNVRLAKLKGVDPEGAQASKKSTYQPPDSRTQQEQMDDLMNEIGDELELESHQPDPATEVEYRLSQLKGTRGAERGPSDTQASSSKGGEGNLNIVNNLNKGGTQKPLTYSKNINTESAPAGKGKDNDNVDLEEMNKLIAQAASELEMDAQKAIAGLQQDKEIMEKLNEIKKRRKSEQDTKDGPEDEDVEKARSQRTLKFNIEPEEEEGSHDEEDDDLATKRLIKQLLEESKLDEAAMADGYDPAEVIDKKKLKQSPKKSNLPAASPAKAVRDEDLETDELPWCCICNENATVRCHGCDLDLYCDKCFHEGHDGSLNHKTSRYVRSKSLEGL